MGCSIGFLTSSMFKTVRQSSTLTPTLIIPLMLFSGLHNKLDSIPKWISWFQYCSPFRYGLQALLNN
jgi:ABC-type multidrug transport system permease subunit